MGKRAIDPGLTLPGRKGIEELLRHSPERLGRIYLRQGAKFKSELLQSLVPQAGGAANRKGIEIEELSPQEFDELAGDENAQGILGVLKESTTDLGGIIDRALAAGSSGIVVVCDQINDPQNLGAVLRVAEAAGVSGVIITRDKSAPITAAVRKASAGASELVPVVSVVNLQRTLEELKRKGFWVYGAAVDSGSIELYSAEFTFPMALVVGSEGSGLRALTKKLCDGLVRIPILGRVESLNVSQAASVLLYELVRRKL